MDTQRLGMTFGEFYVQRSDVHNFTWIVAGFLVAWAMLYFGAGTLHGAPILSAVVAFALTVFSCLFIIPLLAIQPLVLLTIYVEARWRIRHDRPYVAPPPMPYSPPPERPKVEVVERKRGGWLIPLAIGLWIGSSWGGED
jgi:hypothetical protein